MAVAKTLLLILGVGAAAVGFLWIGQGSGYVQWPESSFMINDVHWVYYGLLLAIAGLIAIAISRRGLD